jgi:hypothetical protein
VHSFVSVTIDAAQTDVTLTSTAAARIGGAATLEAGGDLAVDVVNVVDVAAAGGPVAVADVAVETIVLVDSGATLPRGRPVRHRTRRSRAQRRGGRRGRGVTSAGMAGGGDRPRPESESRRCRGDDRTAAGTPPASCGRTGTARPIIGGAWQRWRRR